MSRFWSFLTHVHALAGPVVMLLYPLYASVMAMESASKADDEQWLAYWIFYSFLTLAEMLLQPVLQWIPIWYSAKLVFVGWLVLPQFRGAAFIYSKFVRQQIRKYGLVPADSARRINGDHDHAHHTNGGNIHKPKNRLLEFFVPNKTQY